MITISTKDIENILTDHNNGIPLTRKNKVFYQGQPGTLRHDAAFIYTHSELQEYVKCATDVKYFISKYFQIELRAFQEAWIDSFITNRFNIHMNSHQTGYSSIFSLVYLHYLIFNCDKNILLVSNKGIEAEEFMSKLYNNYLKLPYFLKPGIVTRNRRSIKLSNGSKMSAGNFSEGIIDILFYIGFARILPNLLDTHYIRNVAKLANDGRVVLQSTPNGMNKFMEFVQNSERKDGDPEKNVFKTTRTYWWEVPGRDDAWKNNEIRIIGTQSFMQNFDLQFITK